MNLILLHPEDLQGSEAVLRGRRAKHVHEVHRASVGDVLTIGLLGGKLGEGKVLAVAADEVRLGITLTREPPAPPNIELLLALPRPKILRKVLAAASSLGIKRMVLVNAARVEKSYFGSPVVTPEGIAEHVHLGLEQARDTVPMEVRIEPLFRPFVEDRAPGMYDGAKKLLAHPTFEKPLEACDVGTTTERAVLAIGPEGGWVPFEVGLLEKAGFQGFSLGERILRVDTAVPAIVGQVELVRRLAR